MNKKLTVTVGIPAYNEEANIGRLLNALLKQKREKFVLNKIIVISDGSTDKTVESAKSVQSPLIKVIDSKNRFGQQIRQNQLISMFRGEILIIIEADTLPYDNKTLNNLVAPFLKETSSKVGMAVGQSISLPARTLVEEIESHGIKIKDNLFLEWRNSDNLYSAGGQAMKALSRNFTAKLQWPLDVQEDSYTYLRLKQLNLQMVKQQNAMAYARRAATLEDYIKRNKKFVGSKQTLKKYFPEDLVNKEFNPPINLIIKHLILAMFQSPLLTLLYFIESLLVRILNSRGKEFNPLYQPSSSTKNLAFSDEEKLLPKNKKSRMVLEQFDTLASDYDRLAFKQSIGLQHLSNLETTFIDQHIKNDKSTLSYLDMGVGTGRNARILLDKGIGVTGVDISENMLRETKQKLGPYVEKEQLRLQRIDLNKKLPFGEEKFDGALCIRVIKYLTNWRNLICEAGRVIKKDGVFILEISNKYSAAGISQLYRNYFTFQPAEVEDALSKAGFEVLDKRAGSKLPLVLYRHINSEKAMKFVNKVEPILKIALGQVLSRNLIYYCRKTQTAEEL